MATYKEIKGVTVQTKDSDPNLFVGTWSSGGALNTARYAGTGFGTGADSGIVAGANVPAPSANSVEQYNGTSWTEIAEINTGRYVNASGFGSVTAGLIMGGVTNPGGSNTGATESWNGSAWTEVNDLNEGRASYASSSGSPYTSGFIAGGSPGPAAPGETETWDGTSWTETTDLNTGRAGCAGSGVSSSSGLAFGGIPNRTSNESWNGSSWTEVGDLNTGREYLNGAGIQTSALAFAGRTSPPQTFKTQTESWDGSSWTEVADLATARFQGMSAGVATSAFYAGGEVPGPSESTATEEFTFPSSPILTEGQIFLSGGTTLKGFGKAAGIPAATWASGGSLNAGRYRVSASNTGGTVSASIIFGGYAPSSPPPNNYFASTESYDGTSFTEVNDLNTARSSASGFGSSTSAIMAAGNQSPKAQTEVWNGTSWTEVNDINTGRSQLAGGGISGTAGLIFGGSLPGYSMQSKTETWNGTSWTETGDLNLARDELAGSGVQTAAFAVAGKVKESGGPPTWYQSNTHEQWDGSSWTETTEINTAVSAASAAGHTSSGLKIGGTAGLSPSGQTKTEFWNGSSWTELNDLSTQRQYLAQGSGTGVSNIVAGGYNGSTYGITNNEEWESDNTLSTVTVS